MQNVIFSERAYVAMMAETIEHIKTETGGIFLGHYKENTWYVIESVDPGPQSIFRVAYFEYDTAYINRLINKLNKIYDEPLRLIGLWHRHPGSMDTFSSTDDGTNAKYAELNPEGAISALVNIDPNFRVTVYAVTRPCQYTRIKYTVGDTGIPSALRTYASIESLKENFRRAYKNGYSAGEKHLSLKDVLKATFIDPIDKGFHVLPIQDDDIESTLEKFETDIGYLSELGIDCTMKKSDAGTLQLYESKSTLLGGRIGFGITVHNRDVYIIYGKKTFRYISGMIENAHKREAI